MKREVCEFRWEHIPYPEVAALLRARGAELILPSGEAGARRAERRMATLYAEVGKRQVARDVIVDVGEPEESGGPFPIVRIPVSWRAAEHSELFPVMDGQLEAYPIAADRTQMSFQGNYRPPLGRLGDTIDGLFMHRVAEESVQRFLRSFAQRLRHAWLEQRSGTPKRTRAQHQQTA